MSRSVLTTDQFNSWVPVLETLSDTLKFTGTSVVPVTLALLISMQRIMRNYNPLMEENIQSGLWDPKEEAEGNKQLNCKPEDQFLYLQTPHNSSTQLLLQIVCTDPSSIWPISFTKEEQSMRVKTRSEVTMFVRGSQLGFTLTEQSCLTGRTDVPCQNEDLTYESQNHRIRTVWVERDL